MRKDFKYTRQQSLSDRIKELSKFNITLIISLILGIIVAIVNVIFMFNPVAVAKTSVAILSIVLGILILVLSFIYAIKNKEVDEFVIDLIFPNGQYALGLVIILIGIVNLIK